MGKGVGEQAQGNAEEAAWLNQLATLLKSPDQQQRKAAIKARLSQHLVDTGRTADPAVVANAGAAAAEAARAVREDMVQNLVADRSEIGANVSLTEGHAAATARPGQVAKALADALAAQVTAIKAIADASAKVPKGKLTAAMIKEEVDRATEAKQKADAAVAKATPTKLDYEAQAPAILKRVGERVARVRDTANLNDPALLQRARAAVLKVTPSLPATDQPAAIEKYLKDQAEASFYKQIAEPLLLKEKPADAGDPAALKARAELRLHDMEVEQIFSEKVAGRIDKEVDDLDSKGLAQRILHPLTRLREIEAIVAQEAEQYGYTNLAHFISRHGAPRNNPDAGKTTIGGADDATRPETTRTADDAAGRVITGVGPDQAETDPIARAALLGAKGQGPVKVKAADGSALPDEMVNVPLYAEVGDQVAAASSQHSSAKAALFMIDEVAAQAARAERENPAYAGKKLEVFTGREDVDGDKLGTYPEPGGLGAAYAVDESGFADTDHAEKLNVEKSLDKSLHPDIVEKRRILTTKTLGAMSSVATELPDALHGGFNLMTLFTKSVPREATVLGEDQALANLAREKAKAAFMVAKELELKSLPAGTYADAMQAAKDAADFKAAFQGLAAAKGKLGKGDPLTDPATIKWQAAVDSFPFTEIPQGFTAAKVAMAKYTKDLESYKDASVTAGDAAAVAAVTLSKANTVTRKATLSKREAQGKKLLDGETARADSLRLGAQASETQRDLSAKKADEALARTVAASDLPQARIDLQGLTDGATRTEAARVAAEHELANARKHLAELEAVAAQAPVQANAMLGQAQDALAAVEAELQAADHAVERARGLLLDGKHKDTPRLREELLRADAALAQKSIEKSQAEFALAQVQAAKSLAEAQLSVNTARQHAEQAANLHGNAPSEKLLADWEAAKVALANKRKERDAARDGLAAFVGPGHPALADSVDDAAALADAASTAFSQATTAANDASGPLQARLKALVPGGDVAKTLALQASFGTATADAAQAQADQSALARAQAAKAKLEEQIAEIQREAEVLDKGEAVVLAGELSKSWAPQSGENASQYEARMTNQRELIRKSAEQAAAENAAAQNANTAAVKAREDTLAETNQLLDEGKAQRVELEKQHALRAVQQATAVNEAKARQTELARLAAERKKAAADDQAQATATAEKAGRSRKAAQVLETEPSAEAKGLQEAAASAKVKSEALAAKAGKDGKADQAIVEGVKRLAEEADRFRAEELRLAQATALLDEKAAAAASERAEGSTAAEQMAATQANEAIEAVVTEEGKGSKLAEAHAAALKKADAEILAAQALSAAATRARDEAKNVGDRLAAELATRATLNAAHSAVADAEAVARIAGEKAKALPIQPALEKAARLAEHALLVATKVAELAQAQADLDAAEQSLKTSQSRYTAGKLAYDNAFQKTASARSEVEKKLVAAWPAVDKRLDAARIAAQAAVDKVKADAHGPAVLALAAAKLAVPT